MAQVSPVHYTYEAVRSAQVADPNHTSFE